ncbi:MAG: hypothetical protein KJO79_06455 [Verrucomicrobiae bacterium]|nr:hypothetical protein [Verrucomicrobiae bacterium]NNJ86802.1 hypothetical protein [Akkermansiaceae bacterium]
MKTTIQILSLCSSLLIISCGEKKSTDSASDNTSQTGTDIESIIVTKEPEAPQSITEVRKHVEVGKKITLSGKVMGSDSPFVPGRALVMLGDPAVITSCDLRPGDSCSTPWDVCCDEPEDVKAAIATIQILDADGKPLKQGIKGVGGIKELSNLVVKGIIAEGSNDDNLLVNATAIYVKP